VGAGKEPGIGFRAVGGGSRVHGEVQGDRPSAWDAVYRQVGRIPRGRVMTYGQIATLLGSRLSPRAVGWAMHGSPRGVPWHRVVNASGGCSTERMPDIAPGLQKFLLEAEGIEFRPNGTLDLARYRWIPPARRNRARKKTLRKRARKILGEIKAHGAPLEKRRMARR
jgi:methylated-DNA-protein-cysteine methyltransferase-like protein